MHINRWAPGLAGAILIALGLSACGGGGGGTSPAPAPTPVLPEPPAVTTYLVNTKVDAGSTISPPHAVVEPGKTASFVITVLPGFSLDKVSGAGGTLVGNTYTTGPISQSDKIVITTKDDRFSIKNMRIQPRALFDDEFKTTPVRIEVETTGKGFQLFVTYFSNYFDGTLAGSYLEEPLYDDGTHGDRVAGDGIYTRLQAPGMTPRLRYYEKSVDALQYGIVAKDAAGKQLTSVNWINPALELGVVGRQHAVATTKVSDDIFASANMVNLVMPEYKTQPDHLRLVSKKLYTAYADQFDVLVSYAISNVIWTGIPSSANLKTNVKGINVEAYDATLEHGSAGRLQQVIDMASSINSDAFNHELGHKWGFHLNKPELNLTRDAVNNVNVSAHIGSPSTLLGPMGNSLMLAELPNGDFRVDVAPDNGQYHGRKFTDLELYLMGLIPPSAVSPHRFVLDQSVIPVFSQVIPRNKTSLVTIADIVRVYGERVPNVANSQKSFATVFVGVSDTPMTAPEVAIIDRTAKFYGSTASGGVADSSGAFTIVPPPSFYAATSGLATLVTTVPPKK